MNIKELEENGYMILNGIIKDISIIRDDNRLMLTIPINGDGWRVDYGGYDLNDDYFMGIQSLVELLSVIGVDNLYDVRDKNVRIAVKLEDPVTIIGNIIYDEWFDYNTYKVEPSDIETQDIETQNEELEEEEKIIETTEE